MKQSVIVKHKSLESLECGYVQHLEIYTGKWDSEHPKRTSINVEGVTRYDYNRITSSSYTQNLLLIKLLRRSMAGNPL